MGRIKVMFPVQYNGLVVSYNDTTKFYFYEQRVKTEAKKYQMAPLNKWRSPLGGHWIFQQDTKAKCKNDENWLEENSPEFIKA